MAKFKLFAEVTGSVWKVLIEPGQQVQVGETIILIESMKMEIPVDAEEGGKLTELLVREGDPVEEGQVIGMIEA